MKHLGRLLGMLMILVVAVSARAQTAGQQTPGPASGALGAPGYVDLKVGLAYTTNAYLTPGNPVGDGIALAGLDIDYVHQGAKLDFDALGNIDRLEYLKRSFPGSFYGHFNGSAVWGHPTDWFQWLLSDSFGEAMVDPLAAPTPVNLQTVNYVTTGPTVNFNFGTPNRLTLFGLYSRTTFQSSPFDSQSYEGGASFRHALSAVSSLSLQATSLRTEFLDPAELASFPGAAAGYDTRTASLGYTTKLERTQFAATAGYNTVDYGGKVHGAPLASLQLSRQVSPFSSLFLTGQTGYSTLGGSLQSPTGALPAAGAQATLATGIGAAAGTAAAAPFKQTAGSLGWTFQRARTTVTLMGTASEQRYVQQQTFDQTAETASASWRRELGPNFSAQLQASQTFGHYAQINADNRASTVNLSLSKQFRNAILTAYAQRLQQRTSGQTAGLPVASYNDERVGLELTYDLVGHRPAGRR
jgi:hypothetical protein